MIARQRVRGWLLGSLATAVLAGACSDPVEPRVPSSIEAVAGNPTAGIAGTVVNVPGVRVTDQFGNNLPGAPVTFSPGPRSGFVSGREQITGSDGIARPESWRLGSDVGTQSLIARSGTDTVWISVTALPGDVNNVVFVRGNPATAAVGATLQSGVRVVDANNNGVEGVEVVFAVEAGSGSLEGAMRTSDADGFATVDGWTLGTELEPQVLSARVTATIVATLTVNPHPGPPASLTVSAGDGQTTNPGDATPVAPVVTVRDAYGNGVPGITVAFEVVDGGGQVRESSVTTAADGSASPGVWLLGPAEGPNELTATVEGLAPVVVRATAEGERVEPRAFLKVAGDVTTCPLNTSNCLFAVQVETLLGQAVAGATVIWTSGGSSLSTTTNARGFATAPNIVTSSAGGNLTQTARLESTGDELAFTFRHVPGGQYDIELRFIGTATPSQQAAFRAAAARWERVITGNLPSVTFTAASGATAGICGVDHPAIVETIDDLVIFVQVEDIDGPGQILGRAAPCYTRSSSGLPIVGIMELDSSDLAVLESDGKLGDVLLHEIGHVLGFGTLWDHGDLALLADEGSADPYYTGDRAVSGFVLGGGMLVNGIPVENTGGAGTRDSHWRETTFANELMTGFIGNGGNPLSIMTIGSLMDIGYEVDFGAADPYQVPAPMGSLRALTASGLTELRELPMPAPRQIDDRR